MGNATVCLIYFDSTPSLGESTTAAINPRIARVASLIKAAGYCVHLAILSLVSPDSERDRQGRDRCQTSLQDGSYIHWIESTVRRTSLATHNLCGDFYFSLRHLYLEYGFDLFHIFSLVEVGYVATLLAKEYGIPVVHSVQGSDLHGQARDYRYCSQIRWSLENSNWATFGTQNVQRRAIALVAEIRGRCSTIVDSVAPANVQSMEPPPFLTSIGYTQRSRFVIGAIGPFKRGNGVEHLLDACAYLHSSIELSLVLMGGGIEDDWPYWEQEIAASRLGDRLRIIQPSCHDEVLASLPHLDVLVLPAMLPGESDDDSRVALEAMLAGCPIVATSVNEMAELIEEERAGLVVEPADSGDLMAALWQLALHPAARRILGARARQVALTRCAPEVEQREWEGVYQRVLHQCRGGFQAIAPAIPSQSPQNRLGIASESPNTRLDHHQIQFRHYLKSAV